MSYKSLKFLILWIPTIVVGLWEYVRHVFLLPYISMELGNFLAPALVFLFTLTLLRGLFGKLEQTQEALQRERVSKASFEQREQLARELHDGISQSLFLLSVKLDKLEHMGLGDDARETTVQIRQTVKHVYEDVRQSIASLQSPAVVVDDSWLNAIHGAVNDLLQNSGVRAKLDWQLPEGALSNKQLVELQSIIREALMNVRKYAQATEVEVISRQQGEEDFVCEIKDNGVGADPGLIEAKDRYGIRMMRDRAEQMGWLFDIRSAAGAGTTVRIQSGGEGN
ncbi:two-component system nitrate/nitrite sensor histidine kinase NarQ [Paenibacillus sp. BK033]|uniref:sensor histidine kinase n=1 Tax=Paenibacillus sp. BK033 TaxID=2512133 RepID=UPI00104BFA16|nr:histidine kinase [Paenibacillus sp. BK033]TCN00787.1 two-component system nitrate/nitrite sensor histidine kinase NarQ [Paenibacillus sp. BK033]